MKKNILLLILLILVYKNSAVVDALARYKTQLRGSKSQTSQDLLKATSEKDITKIFSERAEAITNIKTKPSDILTTMETNPGFNELMKEKGISIEKVKNQLKIADQKFQSKFDTERVKEVIKESATATKQLKTKLSPFTTQTEAQAKKFVEIENSVKNISTDMSGKNVENLKSLKAQLEKLPKVSESLKNELNKKIDKFIKRDQSIQPTETTKPTQEIKTQTKETVAPKESLLTTIRKKIYKTDAEKAAEKEQARQEGIARYGEKAKAEEEYYKKAREQRPDLGLKPLKEESKPKDASSELDFSALGENIAKAQETAARGSQPPPIPAPLSDEALAKLDEELAAEKAAETTGTGYTPSSTEYEPTEGYKPPVEEYSHEQVRL